MMGRVVVQIRVTEEEKGRWAVAAAVEGKTLSEWVRDRLNYGSEECRKMEEAQDAE
jgi:hypothetical protein